MTRLPLRSRARYVAGRFAQAPMTDRLEAVTDVTLLALAEAAVRLLPLPSAARLFGVRLAEASSPASDMQPLPPWARRRLHIVAAATWASPKDGSCLRQSLVAGQRLRSLSPELRFGVRRVDGRVEAHAWIVVQGVEIGAADYVELRDPRRATA